MTLKPCYTIFFLNFQSGQTVRTNIRLLLEEQPDQDFHCLHLDLLLLVAFLCGDKDCTKFGEIMVNYQ